MKRFLSLFLAALCCLPAVAQIYDTEIDGICYKVNGDEATVTRYSEDLDRNAEHYQGEIVIPEKITYLNKQYPVTTIGYQAFFTCPYITGVYLPNSVTTIEDEAFKCTTSEHTFHMGSGVRTIGKDAFCLTTMTRLDIDPANQWFVVEDRVFYSADHKRAIALIAGYADSNSTIDLVLHDDVEIVESGFNHGARLHTLQMGKAVKWIGDYAFNFALAESIDQPNLILPDGIEHIGKYAFEMCIRVNNLHLPDGLTRLEEYSFSFVAPETIHMPENLKVICDGALYCDAGSAYRNLVLPEGLDSIGKYGITCIDCDSLIVPASVRYLSYNSLKNTSRYIEIKAPLDSIATGAMPSSMVRELVLPKTLKRLERSAFYPCYYLQRIVWPDELEFIGAYALAGIKVSPLVVPATVRTLDLGAFSDNVWQPHTYYFTSPEPPVCLRPDVFENIMYEKSTLYVPRGCREAYAGKEPWSWFGTLEEYDEIVLPPVPTRYDFMADELYYKVVSEEDRTCEVSYDLNFITDKNLYDFKELTIPEEVAHDGKTFKVIGIEGGAMGNLPLEHVTLPQTLTYMDGAFMDCQELASIDIPENVTSMGGAFSGCIKLKSVCLPANVENISSAFYGCTNLEQVNIPNSVIMMDGAFQGCSGLKSLVIPDHLTQIAECTFFGCSNLTSIKLPAELLQIDDLAFAGCSSLQKIVLPEHLRYIKTAAFEECWNLTDIVSLNPEPPSAIGYGQFANLDATLHVPSGSKEAYQGVEMWSCFNIVEDATAISQLNIGSPAHNTYDIFGRRVDDNYQGLVIKNGKLISKVHNFGL